MKKVLVIVLSVAVLLSLSGCMKFEKIDYDPSGQPSIKTLPKQKVIYAQAAGSPEKVFAECLGPVFQAYMALKVKDRVMACPRARWEWNGAQTTENMKGTIALPVPEEVTAVPEQKKKPAVDVKIGFWEYGETAEITHYGPYDAEKVTTDKLHAFIKEKGYQVAGPHEEIYIKGPGMFGKGNPKDYITLIRYQIEKVKIAKKKGKS